MTHFFHIPVQDTSIEGIIAGVDDRLERGEFCHIVNLNPHRFLIARQNAFLRSVQKNASMVICDGIGIKLASHLLGSPLRYRNRGVDVMLGLVALAEKRGDGVFLVGGTGGSAESCSARLRSAFPRLPAVDHFQPPLYSDDAMNIDPVLLKKMDESGARFVFVSLGAVKEEEWIERHRVLLPGRLYMGVGASFRFIGGDLKRAPRWMRSAGLEWLFRIISEPRRLFPRYAHDIPLFLYIVLARALQRFTPRDRSS